jgi:hypothetical protein
MVVGGPAGAAARLGKRTTAIPQKNLHRPSQITADISAFAIPRQTFLRRHPANRTARASNASEYPNIVFCCAALAPRADKQIGVRWINEDGTWFLATLLLTGAAVGRITSRIAAALVSTASSTACAWAARR